MINLQNCFSPQSCCHCYPDFHKVFNVSRVRLLREVSTGEKFFNARCHFESDVTTILEPGLSFGKTLAQLDGRGSNGRVAQLAMHPVP